VFVGGAGGFVVAAQEGTPDAARDAVVGADF